MKKIILASTICFLSFSAWGDAEDQYGRIEGRTDAESPPTTYQEAPPTTYQEAPPTTYQEAPPTTYQEAPPTTYQESPPTYYEESPPTYYEESPPTYYEESPPEVIIQSQDEDEYPEYFEPAPTPKQKVKPKPQTKKKATPKPKVQKKSTKKPKKETQKLIPAEQPIVLPVDKSPITQLLNLSYEELGKQAVYAEGDKKLMKADEAYVKTQAVLSRLTQKRFEDLFDTKVKE